MSRGRWKFGGVAAGGINGTVNPGAPATATGTGNRSAFGSVTVSLPRARLIDDDGRERERRSESVQRYRRVTKRVGGPPSGPKRRSRAPILRVRARRYTSTEYAARRSIRSNPSERPKQPVHFYTAAATPFDCLSGTYSRRRPRSGFYRPRLTPPPPRSVPEVRSPFGRTARTRRCVQRLSCRLPMQLSCPR